MNAHIAETYEVTKVVCAELCERIFDEKLTNKERIKLNNELFLHRRLRNNCMMALREDAEK